jgi:aminopeptidase YwaD
MNHRSLLTVLLTIALCAALFAADLETNLQQHEYYLADSARDGRGIGTKGLDSAAAYLARQYAEIGLQPAFHGSYFQPFEMGWGVTLHSGNHITLRGMTIDTSGGMMPLGFSSPGTARGPLVFIGYGITAPEYNYDDYAGVDTKGAILLCLTGEPGEYDTASVFAGVSHTTHSGIRAKASNAKLHEAAGLLLVEGPIYAGKEAEVLRAPRADEPYMDCGLPAALITRAAVAKLFPEFDLLALQKFIDGKTAPRSMAVRADTVDLGINLTRKSVTVKNVGAVLPGDSSIIVIGAHYDHLGYGQSGSLEEKPGRVHPGADDNASGTSSIVETARLLKANPPRATVMFTSFTAEEVGLGGSGYLVKHFPDSLSRVKAMFNLDMVGRMRDHKLTVVGCKTAEQFKDLVPQAGKDLGFEVICKGDGYGPSDHMNFYLAGIPVLYLFTNTHEDYHRSSDTPDKINYPDMARVVRFTANLAHVIDEYPRQLTYVKTSEPPQQGGGRFRSAFGSIPDFSQPDTLKGMLLSGAREGGAAQKAGLQKGDLLLKLGKVTINNLYDLTYALQIYAPGDTVAVTYRRATEEITTQAVLQQSTR